MVKTRLFKAIDSLIPLDENLATFRGNGYSENDKNQAKTDKTEHEMEKRKKPNCLFCVMKFQYESISPALGSLMYELNLSQPSLSLDQLIIFNYTDVKSASTPVNLEKPLVKDGDADVDVHLYRSMIGSLMHLTTSRPDIMFAVCACARFQVTLKTSHLLAVKRIFRYSKGKPTLGLWYSRDSPFKLVAYTDSDYAG
ncbi:hypothetical protein Tco_0608613, partial [Tanacetum coccineum]